MKVEMHEYRIATAPEPLETTGLGPCIGVAIIYANFGFALHSPDIIYERESVTDPFFMSLDAQIPNASRQDITPIIAGGSHVHTGTSRDQEVHKSTLASRAEILERLSGAGFAQPNVRWAGPHEIASLFVDTRKRIIFRETIDMRDRDARPSVELFKC
jgi:hypothetical protein